MIISHEHKLSANNYIKTKTTKRQIVLGNTNSYGLSHVDKRYIESYSFKRVPHFSILRSGEIFQHFDTQFYSLFLDCNIDEQVISIALENIGLLFENSCGIFHDIYNNIYNGEVIKQDWKNCNLWQPYTEQQMNSTINLCRYLLKEHKIPNKSSDIFVFKKDIEQFNGVVYRSNHDDKHYDLNPTWNFQAFKEQIEIEL